jgi:hypothetical protein
VISTSLILYVKTNWNAAMANDSAERSLEGYESGWYHPEHVQVLVPPCKEE